MFNIINVTFKITFTILMIIFIFCVSGEILSFDMSGLFEKLFFVTLIWLAIFMILFLFADE